jgi:hypothetical protein
MTVAKQVGIALICGTLAIAGIEVGVGLSIPGDLSFVSTAEARVGRPLTPVSVAGVARRTVRRCAAGVTC